MLRGGVQGQSCKQGDCLVPVPVPLPSPGFHVLFLALESGQPASWHQGLFK